MDDFDEALAKSRHSEKLVAKLLAVEGWELESKNDTFAYDLLFTNGKKVEIKEDKLVGRYGNIAIEYTSRGKPSGISSTEADYWVTVAHTKDGVVVLMTPVGLLRHMCNEKEWHKEKSGGDSGSDTRMYLFKYDVIEAVSNVLTTGKEIFEP